MMALSRHPKTSLTQKALPESATLLTFLSIYRKQVLPMVLIGCFRLILDVFLTVAQRHFSADKFSP